MRSIHSKILLLAAGLLFLAAGAFLASSLWLLDRRYRDEVAQSLETAGQVVESLTAARIDSLRGKAETAGLLPMLRAVVAAGNAQTIEDTARAQMESLEVPIFELYSAKGALLYGGGGEPAAEPDPATRGLVSAALEGDTSDTVGTRGGKLALLVAARLGTDQDALGAVVVGRPIDDAFAAKLANLARSDVTLLDSRGTVVASSDPQAGHSKGEPPGGGAFERVMPVRDAVGAEVGSYRLRANVERFTTTRRQLLALVLTIGLVILVAGLAMAFRFSRALTRPIVELTNLAKRSIATNDLSGRAAVAGRDEIAALASSFNHFLEEIGRNRDELESRVQARTAELAESKRNVQLILDNLGQGFFAIDSEGKVQPGSSREAARLFGGNPEGRFFGEVAGLVGESREQLLDWLGLSFRGAMPFADLMPLGPRRAKTGDGRFIGLEYRAVAREGRPAELEKIICVATDRTEEERLRGEMASEREKVQLVLRILKDREAFRDFLGETRALIEGLAAGAGKLEPTLRRLHTIKGGAMSYHLTELARAAHGAESGLVEARSAGATAVDAAWQAFPERVAGLKGAFAAFLAENRALLGEERDDLVIEADAIRRFRGLLASEAGTGSPLEKAFHETFELVPMTRLLERYASAVTDLARRQEKDVELVVEPAPVRVEKAAYQPLLAALIHVFRNAVDHGIELPSDRRRASKPERGRIEVKVAERAGRLEIRIEDDGRGIDPAAVRAKALALGVLTPEESAAFDDSAVIQLVFHSGFSTRDEATMTSGRGVGLAAVKEEVERLRGDVRVESRPGRGSGFFLELPLLTG